MVIAARRLLGALFFIAVLAGCGGFSAPGSESVTAAAESPYCSTTFSISNPITVTAYAQYFYRATDVNAGLSGNPVARGIPHAEVVVTDVGGSIIQCSKTDASGNISFQINKTAGNYAITVNSRAYNTALRASVLVDPSSNSVYSISTPFTLTGVEVGAKSVGTFSAFARTSQSANMEGAAFHILYNFHLANEYIRTQTGNASFVASKVSAYWKQGFNPGSYVGVSSGLSFYLQGQNELYILGGVNGNTKTADTDHFDDSVVLHEYGHFLEDVYGKSTSPGGSHNGNFIIDPRLAWSEGWANFLQGAIITPGSPSRGIYYIDTIGYVGDTSDSGESGGIAIKFDLSATGMGVPATQDRVTVAGEGTFRELSISRTLYKVVTTTSIPFSSLWTVFTSATNGMRAPANVFSHISLFNQYLDVLVPGGQATAWNNILAGEMQNKTTVDYADPVTSVASCPQFPRSLTPVADSDYVISSSPFIVEPRSNKLRSNDFYRFYYNGAGGTLAMTYSQVVGQTIDLDLYLYNSTHNYQEDYIESLGQATGGVRIKSDRANPAIENGSESFSLSGIPAGYYLLNVKANTLNKSPAQVNGTAQYSLTFQGLQLCPTN